MFAKFLIFTIFFFHFSMHSRQEHENRLPFKKVVIWGHKLHTHTHSYVHYAFHKAFKYLGYDTYWLDNNDNIQHIDFSNSLFITEGQVDQNMPLRDDCRYILHYCYQRNDRYKKLYENGNCVSLYPYLNHGHSEPYWPSKKSLCDVQEMEKYVEYNVKDRYIIMPWATDLLPHEIEENKKRIVHTKKENAIYWVGTDHDKLPAFRRACQEYKIRFVEITGINLDANISLIQKSMFAPAIQRQWQCERGYIPCRIFKNISYGQFGITNSKTVYELFEGKIVFNEDPYLLLQDSMKKLANLDIKELYEQMDFVKNHHTYLNRINCLLDFLHMVKPLENYIPTNTGKIKCTIY